MPLACPGCSGPWSAVRQAAKDDRAFRRRRRVGAAFRRQHTQVERAAAIPLRSFFRAVRSRVLARLAAAQRPLLVEELYQGGEWRAAFLAQMRRSLRRGLFAGLAFEASVSGGRQEQRFAPLVVQDADARERPPSIFVDLSPQLRAGVDEWLEQRAVGVWGSVNETTRKLLAKSISDGLADGLSMDKLAESVGGVLAGYSEYQAMRVARTECLPAETVVNGAVATAAYRREYRGPLVEIVTHAGRKFAGTPNHPMLTVRGWVALGDLTEADHLVCNGCRIEPLGSSGDQHVQAPPSSICEVFNSLAAVGFASREATRKPDFHGDGREDYVDVLRPARPLLIGAFSPITERVVNGLLSPSDVRQVLAAACCAPFARDVPVDRGHRLIEIPHPSSPRSHRPSDDGLRDAVLFGQLWSGRAVGILRGDSMDGHVDDLAAVAGGHQHGSCGLMASPHARRSAEFMDRARVATEHFGDGDGALAGDVQIDRLLSLRRIENWLGHVYNLTTVDGYFCANGFYTGNTTGSMNFGQHIERKQLDIPGKEWISTLDNRNRGARPGSRFDHLAPDGQTVLAGEPFIVSGQRLLHPGDTSLGASAGNVVHCRCAAVGAWPPEARVRRAPEPTRRPSPRQPSDRLPRSPLKVVEHGKKTSKEFKKEVRETVRALPKNVTNALREFGATIHAGEMVTSIMPELKGVRPRGWSEGSTWDNAEGLYRWSDKKVVVSQKSLLFGGKTPVDSDRVPGVIRHEIGHAFDEMTGLSKQAEFRKIYGKCCDAIYSIKDAKERDDTVARLAYFLQSGEGGPQEAVAEGFGIGHGGGAGSARQHELFRQWFGPVLDFILKTAKAL